MWTLLAPQPTKAAGAKIGVAHINGSHVPPPKGEGTQRRKIKGKVEEEEQKPKEVVLLRFDETSTAGSSVLRALARAGNTLIQAKLPAGPTNKYGDRVGEQRSLLRPSHPTLKVHRRDSRVPRNDETLLFRPRSRAIRTLAS
ncbi:hypothetical protein GW17_00018658 [Ensete ventricosum]|nr:hypothetical protein GW17_00018658 [Ensete ventricosum]RZR82968.1 hypothetical protein BHM03_00009501 [Ensete ventricosum]